MVERAAAGLQGLSRSARHQTRSKRYFNLVQPVDTNQVNDLLQKAVILEHAALPITQYGQFFNPEQTTSTLRRLPKLMWAQQGRVAKGE